VTFSSIPTTLNGKTLRDLVVVTSATSPEMYVRFNSDSGSNYNFVWMLGFDNSAFSGSSSSQARLALARVAWGGNTITQIFDFSQTNKHKSTISRANGAGVANNAVEAIAGRWASTAAITSMTLQGLSGGADFPAGSTFSLYGIEG
jgi:hypothetical protein